MVSVEQLIEQAEKMGLLIVEQCLHDEMGLYDGECGIIYLHDGLNHNQRRCALQHELIHAEHHREGLMLLDPHKEEYLTRKETAQRLISQVEYITAENIYEGDAWHMAAELGVTVQVIRDYQDTLSQCA